MHSEPEDTLEPLVLVDPRLLEELAARKNFRIVTALAALAVILSIVSIILVIIAW